MSTDSGAAKLTGPRIAGLTVVITIASLLGPIGTDMYLPALPHMMAGLGTSAAGAQATISIFVIAVGVGQAVAGPLSDRWGRRGILLGGVALFILMSLAAAAAQSLGQLLAVRVFQALGAAAGGALSRAVVRDLFEREEAARIMSFVASGIAMGPMVAPAFGGLITLQWGWRGTFVALAVTGAVVWLSVFRALPETNRFRDPTATNPVRILRNYRTLLAHPLYRAYLAASVLSFTGVFVFISGVAFVLIGDMGMRPDAFGAAFGLAAAGFVIGAQFNARTVRRWGIETMCRRGAVIVALGGLTMLALALLRFAVPAVGHPAAVIAPMIFMLVGTGLVLPNAMAGAVSPFPQMAGTASALLGLLQFGFAALVGVLVGFAIEAIGAHIAMAAILAASAVATPIAFRLLLARA